MKPITKEMDARIDKLYRDYSSRKTLDAYFPYQFQVDGLTTFSWDGIIAGGEVSVVYGDPDAGKGNFVTGLACAVASTSQFYGRKCGWLREDGEWWPAGVVYFALERHLQVRNRIQAFVADQKLEYELPIAVCGDQFDLREADAWELLAEVVYSSHRSRHMVSEPGSGACDFKPDFNLIIIDNWSLALAGGSDSDVGDVSSALVNVKKLADVTGAHVMIIHHSPVAGDGRMRGAGNLNAAIDISFHVEQKKAYRVATIKKNSNHRSPEKKQFHFGLQTGEATIFDYEDNILGTEPASILVEMDGPPKGALSRPLTEPAPKAKSKPTRASPNKSERPAYDALLALGEQVSEPVWRARYDADKSDDVTAANHRTRFSRAKTDLIKKKLIAFDDGKWSVTDPALHSEKCNSEESAM